MKILYFPFILQGVVIFVNEFFHKARGLGLWERLGHPLDTFTVFVPISYIAIHEFTESDLNVYVALGVFSCFFITKDEFIHKEECVAFENWLHSVLFILHPMVFVCSGILWKYYPENQFIQYQPIIVGVFMLYQILRWSIPWKIKK